jgi:hypothetical protein
MAKNIKKSFKYLIIFFGIIIIVPSIIMLAISIPALQTILVRRITSHFSEEIKSTISVGKIEYDYFNRLKLNDLLIKDKNNDTLLFFNQATIGIKRLNFSNKTITFGKITITNPVIALITDSTGVMNLKWYLDLIRSKNDTLKKASSTININEIDISNARFALINENNRKENEQIDFSNLHLSQINGIMEDFKIRNDSTTFSLYNVAFREEGGFTVKKLSGDVLLANNNITFQSAFLYCDSSIIRIPHLAILPDSSDSFNNFAEEVKLDLLLDKSLVNSSDLQYFVSSLKGINESIWISGKILGTISELRGRDIEILYRNYTSLDCDFDLSGLPKIDNTFMYIGVNKLNTNIEDIEKIRIPGKDIIKIPEFFYKLGTVSFNGSFTGFTTDFVTYGKFQSAVGTLSTDISLRPEESNRFKIKGLVTGSSIALGQITGKNDLLGSLSMRTNVDMVANSFEKFSGNLSGLIDSIEINNYKYRNISFNGIFSEKTWDGNVKIRENNIRMDLLGMFNFKEELPEFDFTLNLFKADLYKLKFVTDTSAAVSMLLTANFKGNSIDNLNGEIKLVNSTIRKLGTNLELNDFSLTTFTENNRPAISLRSDFADAELRGYYNFTGLGTDFKTVLATIMPSRFPVPLSENELIKNNFTLNVIFKNTEKISNFFNTGIHLSENSNINCTVIPDSIIKIKGEAKNLNFKNNIFEDLSVEALYLSPDLTVNLKTSSLNLLGQSELKQFAVDLNTKPDNFIFALKWDNLEKILNNGNLIARGTYIKNENKTNPVLNIEIDSTDIYNRNNKWIIGHSNIFLDTSAIRINNLYIRNKDRYYLIDGSVSEDPADTLHLEFKGIDISPLNFLVDRKKDPEQISLSLKGQLNGKILLTDIYRNILLESNLIVSNFSMLESEYGDLSVISAWNNEKKVAEINVGNNLNGKKMIDVTGYYNPEEKRIDLTAKADKLPVDALNPLLKIFASGISGTATGKVNLSGGPGRLVLKGALMAENTSMKIDYLQTKYRMNDSIRFDKNRIIFKNIKLTDEKGNTATLNGSVFHEYFQEYGADLLINTNECMVLNTKPKDNELFYGTAYASGVTTIKSSNNTLSFDISAKTGKNTKFYIPLNTSETVSDYSFVTFVTPDTTLKTRETSTGINAAPVSQTNVDLNFDLEVTPDAEVQLIFDVKVGDIMTGHGSGNLNLNIDSKGEFRISGDYIIEDGNYLFTLGNILNKPFSVENGGKITFPGNIYDAEIDIKAIYKLKASLYEILQDDRFNERIPVECQINLSGKLFNPVISLDIYLPTADESTRTYLKNVITTEEELSRQFLYLLVMNSFYSDPSYRSSLTSSTTTGTSAMAVTTTEMVSNQLSNWLSKISNDFDIGFVYRPGYKDISSNEVQLALSTQLLNDKVVINGNFDVRGPGGTSSTTDQLTGDFDIEYKLTDKIRFKVFNRFNNPSTGKQAPYTQGLGVFFREDFDKFSDLFRKKEKSEMKKEEEPEANSK